MTEFMDRQIRLQQAGQKEYTEEEVRLIINGAIQEEREACAKVCEEIAAYYSTDIFPEDGTSIDCNSAKMGRVVTKNCAMEIRARGHYD